MQEGLPVTERPVPLCMIHIGISSPAAVYIDRAPAAALKNASCTWSANVTCTPRLARFSAISKPIKPPPITPAFFGFRLSM